MSEDQPSGQDVPKSQETQNIQVKKSDVLLTNFQALINVCQFFVGIGILYAPQAVYSNGWLLGSLSFGVCSYVCMFSAYLLFISINQQNISPRDINETVQMIIGPGSLYNFSRGFMVFSQIGCGICYIIFMNSYFNKTICYMYQDYCNELWIGPTLSFLIVCSLSFFTAMKFFMKFNIIGVFTQVFCLVCIILYALYFHQINEDETETQIWDFSTFFHTIGIYLFALGCMGHINIRFEMEKQKEIVYVFLHATNLICTLYIVFSSICSYSFKEQTEENILFNLPSEQLFFGVIQFLYAMSIGFSYPLQLYPANIAIDNAFFKAVSLQKQQDQKIPIAQEETQGLIEGFNNDTNKNKGDFEEADNIQEQNDLISSNPPSKIENSINREQITDLEVENIVNFYEEGNCKFRAIWIAYRIIIILLVFLIALLFPSAAKFINFMGWLGGLFYIFILPFMIFWVSFQVHPQFTLTSAIILCLLGGTVTIIGIYYSFIDTFLT